MNEEEVVGPEVSCGARLLWMGKVSLRGSELADGNVCESSEPAEITEGGFSCMPATFFGGPGADFWAFLGARQGRELGAKVSVA